MNIINAVVDVGNTFFKIGVFRNGKLSETIHRVAAKEIVTTLEKHNPQKVLIANVGKERTALILNLKEKFMLVVFDYQTKIPIQNLYKTPQTLGVDRLAAVIGANCLYPQKGNLIIDMGTCITYDFITKEKEYFGGSISLGVQMRFRALNEFTANLPKLNNIKSAALIGTNTENSIKSGVINGTIAEIEGIISRYRQEFGDFNVILCGGDAILFESFINESIFALPNLVLHGLNAILENDKK